MRLRLIAFLLSVAANLSAQARTMTATQDRRAAEYYVSAYARHYHVPIPLVRSIIRQESHWHACAVSAKGAKGLMQLMPATARHFGVEDPCNIEQNISGGVRYLAWLMRLFHCDFRLVAAGYYAGEKTVARRGLSYRNPDAVLYVARLRAIYVRQPGIKDDLTKPTSKGLMR